MNKLIWKKYSPFSRIYTTKIKIIIARILYHLLIPFLKKDKMQIVRQGIKYQVDLTEGLDLSLFIFGSFQKHVIQNKLFSLPEDAVIFDIGANFGIMTLQFAKIAKFGHVYAFEPTYYAFKRLLRNLKINPALANRITPIQSFIFSKSQKNPKINAFSSWKINGTKRKGTHPVNLGISKPAKGIEAISLDDFCEKNKISRVDFIKTDTEGHEHEVLKGAEKTISKYKPVVIFEIGNYFLKDQNIDFLYFLKYFGRHNYFLFDIKSSLEITYQNYHLLIPQYSTIDVIAIPK